LDRGQASWPTRAGAFGQTGKSPVFEARHPVLDGAARVAEQVSDLRARQALGHQQHALQPVVVPGFLGPSNFVLQSHDGQRRIGDGQWLHSPRKPQSSIMRNYLCRYV
jgi:hypothetical protein